MGQRLRFPIPAPCSRLPCTLHEKRSAGRPVSRLVGQRLRFPFPDSRSLGAYCLSLTAYCPL